MDQKYEIVNAKLLCENSAVWIKNSVKWWDGLQ